MLRAKPATPGILIWQILPQNNRKQWKQSQRNTDIWTDIPIILIKTTTVAKVHISVEFCAHFFLTAVIKLREQLLNS